MAIPTEKFACRMVSYIDDQVTFERPGAGPLPTHSVMIPYPHWAELGRPEWVVVTAVALDLKESTID